MASRDQLPDEYFNLSRGEVRRAQELLRQKAEESSMLLTKATRERLGVQEIRKYRYVLIRVRLPGDHVLQVGADSSLVVYRFVALLLSESRSYGCSRNCYLVLSLMDPVPCVFGKSLNRTLTVV